MRRWLDDGQEKEEIVSEEMDKRALFDQFHRVESRISSVSEELADIQERLNQLIEENTSLQIENQHLRDRVDFLTKELEQEQRGQDPEQGMSKSRLNLQKLYEDGFHVCNLYYGGRRLHDEPCVFCLDVIYGEREKI